MQTYQFHVEHPGDKSAGILSYSNDVTVVVSYDPGGPIVEAAGSFVEFMRSALADWFDGAKVTTHLERSIPTQAEDDEDEELSRSYARKKHLSNRGD